MKRVFPMMVEKRFLPLLGIAFLVLSGCSPKTEENRRAEVKPTDPVDVIETSPRTAILPDALPQESSLSPLTLADLEEIDGVLESRDGALRSINLTLLPAERLQAGVEANEAFSTARVVRGKGPLPDSLASLIASMPKLTEFLWTETSVSEEMLQQISSCKELKKLRLSGANLTQKGIASLAQMPSLVDLDISSSTVNDESVNELAKLPKLQKLNLYQTQVGDAAPTALLPLAHQLTWLNLDATSLTDSGVETLTNFDQLTFLHLGRTAITDASAPSLSQLKSLTKLHVTRTAMTQEGWDILKENLPNCEVVTVVADDQK